MAFLNRLDQMRSEEYIKAAFKKKVPIELNPDKRYVFVDELVDSQPIYGYLIAKENGVWVLEYSSDGKEKRKIMSYTNIYSLCKSLLQHFFKMLQEGEEWLSDDINFRIPEGTKVVVINTETIINLEKLRELTNTLELDAMKQDIINDAILVSYGIITSFNPYSGEYVIHTDDNELVSAISKNSVKDNSSGLCIMTYEDFAEYMRMFVNMQMSEVILSSGSDKITNDLVGRKLYSLLANVCDNRDQYFESFDKDMDNYGY